MISMTIGVMGSPAPLNAEKNNTVRNMVMLPPNIILRYGVP